jgi:hypothetical protein
MTLHSKKIVIHTKIISQVNYIAMSVLIDDITIASIIKNILAVLWYGKPHKIKYSTIIGDHIS